jgi:hypothetical protein
MSINNCNIANMSILLPKDRSNRTISKAANLKEYVSQQTDALRRLGKRAFFGLGESIANATGRRKFEIAAGLGTIAMTAGLGGVCAAGAIAGEKAADRGADAVYAHLEPRQIATRSQQTGDFAAAPGQEQPKPVRMEMRNNTVASTDWAALAGIAGVLLLSAGAASGAYGMREHARRNDDEPVWQLAPRTTTPERHATADNNILMLNAFFDKRYRPSRSERLENWCDERAVAVIETTLHAAQGIARGIANAITAFGDWRADLQRRREDQLTISVLAYKPFDTYSTAIEHVILN